MIERDHGAVNPLDAAIHTVTKESRMHLEACTCTAPNTSPDCEETLVGFVEKVRAEMLKRHTETWSLHFGGLTVHYEGFYKRCVGPGAYLTLTIGGEPAGRISFTDSVSTLMEKCYDLIAQHYHDFITQPAKKGQTMHKSRTIFLLDDAPVRAITAVHSPVNYRDGREVAQTFKTMDEAVKEGSFIAVPTRTEPSKLTVMIVVETDVEIEYDSPEPINWVSGVVNTSLADTHMEQERQMLIRADRASRKKKAKELLDNLQEESGGKLSLTNFDDADADEVIEVTESSGDSND